MTDTHTSQPQCSGLQATVVSPSGPLVVQRASASEQPGEDDGSTSVSLAPNGANTAAESQIKTEYRCEYCGDTFNDESRFAAHLRMKACNPRIHRIDEIEINNSKSLPAAPTAPHPNQSSSSASHVPLPLGDISASPLTIHHTANQMLQDSHPTSLSTRIQATPLTTQMVATPLGGTITISQNSSSNNRQIMGLTSPGSQSGLETLSPSSFFGGGNTNINTMVSPQPLLDSMNVSKSESIAILSIPTNQPLPVGPPTANLPAPVIPAANGNPNVFIPDLTVNPQFTGANVSAINTTDIAHTRLHSASTPMNISADGIVIGTSPNFTNLGNPSSHVVNLNTIVAHPANSLPVGFLQTEPLHPETHSQSPPPPPNPNDDDKPKPPKMWSCSECDRKFTSQGSLYHHKWSHTGKTFSCRTCKKKLTNPYQVARHERICSIGRHRCTRCMRIFDEKEDLDAHTNECDGRQEHPCPHCNKSYSAKYLLNKHLELHSDQQFPCGICSKVYESSTRLQQHMRSHTKPVVCPICGKRFAFTQLLKYHLRVHKKEKPFECDLCGRRFTRKNNLKNHRRTHTGERPFKCEFCLRTFAADSTYYIHRKLHLDKRDYKCYICDKGFTKKSFLESHMASHNKERYKCQKCDKTFKHKRSYDGHMRSHLDMEKMIQCNVCFELFQEKSMFEEHMKVHLQEHEKMKQEAAMGLVKMETQRVVKTEDDEKVVKQERNGRSSDRVLRSTKRIKTEISFPAPGQFLCDVCSEVFSTPAHLLKHVKLHVTVGIKAE